MVSQGIPGGCVTQKNNEENKTIPNFIKDEVPVRLTSNNWKTSTIGIMNQIKYHKNSTPAFDLSNVAGSNSAEKKLVNTI